LTEVGQFFYAKTPKVGIHQQNEYFEQRVDLATTCAIHCRLNTGMVIHYLKGEYVGESCDADAILAVVSPYICKID
jgi:hypothetical protein